MLGKGIINFAVPWRTVIDGKLAPVQTNHFEAGILSHLLDKILTQASCD